MHAKPSSNARLTRKSHSHKPGASATPGTRPARVPGSAARPSSGQKARPGYTRPGYIRPGQPYRGPAGSGRRNPRAGQPPQDGPLALVIAALARPPCSASSPQRRWDRPARPGHRGIRKTTSSPWSLRRPQAPPHPRHHGVGGTALLTLVTTAPARPPLSASSPAWRAESAEAVTDDA